MSNLNRHELDVLNRIQRKPELEIFFFRKVRDLKWFDELTERGFFNVANNPEPRKTDDGYLMFPAWPLLMYLETIGPDIQHERDPRFARRVIALMRETTQVAQAGGTENSRTWWSFSKLVKFLPLDVFEASDLEMWRYWLASKTDTMFIARELGTQLLPTLLSTRSIEALEFAKGLLPALIPHALTSQNDVHTSEPSARFRHLVDNTKDMFKGHSEVIGDAIGWFTVTLLMERIDEYLEGTREDEYSSLWRPAIEEHDQNRPSNDLRNVLVSSLRDVLCAYAQANGAAVAPNITTLLSSQVKLFRRLAISVIDSQYEFLSILVDQILSPEYFEYHYQHELFHLLRNHFAAFSEDQRVHTLRTIEALDIETDADETVAQQQRSYNKLIWLCALRGQGFEPAEDAYAEYFEIVGTEPVHPDFSSYMESSWEGDNTPYTADELLVGNLDDLVSILEAFEETVGWKMPTKRALSKELGRAIAIKPQHFAGKLSVFLSVHSQYKYEVLKAYTELWNNRTPIMWPELMSFCNSLVSATGFWEKEPDKPSGALVANSVWIVGAIAELIHAGTRSDSNAFDPSLFPQALEILATLLEHQECDAFEPDGDSMLIAINSARGKCLEALISLALRSCRVADEQSGDHSSAWQEVVAHFEAEMDRLESGNYEFATLWVRSAPNFLYLDKEWTLDHFPLLFAHQDRLTWLCAMHGYAYINTVHEDLYRILKRDGHFVEGLNAPELSSEVKRKIVENIVVAYFQGEETLKDELGLIYRLLDRWNVDEICDVVWFVKSLDGGDWDNFSENFFGLWTSILQRGREIADETDKKMVFSNLAFWSTHVHVLDDATVSLLEEIAPYAEHEYNAYALIENLHRLVDSYPGKVGRIFLSMLNGCKPTYPHAEINSIWNALSTRDIKTHALANEIRESYIKSGIAFPLE